MAAFPQVKFVPDITSTCFKKASFQNNTLIKSFRIPESTYCGSVCISGFQGLFCSHFDMTLLSWLSNSAKYVVKKRFGLCSGYLIH